jgi:hypothetical protein
MFCCLSIVNSLLLPLTIHQIQSSVRLELQQVIKRDITVAANDDSVERNNRLLSELELLSSNEFSLLNSFLTQLQQPIRMTVQDAILGLVKQGKLYEPFYWIPSLAGPTLSTYPLQNQSFWDHFRSDWKDTLAFLSLPMIQLFLDLTELSSFQEISDSKNIIKLDQFMPLLQTFQNIKTPPAVVLHLLVSNFAMILTRAVIREKVSKQLLPVSISSNLQIENTLPQKEILRLQPKLETAVQSYSTAIRVMKRLFTQNNLFSEWC